MSGAPAPADAGGEGHERASKKAARAAEQVPGAPAPADISDERYMMFCLCLVCVVEGADSVLLTSSFYGLQRDLGASLQDLAKVSMCQAVASSLFAPAWGIAADRGVMSKKALLVMGCVLQGLTTMMLARVDRIGPMQALRVVNGAMMASLSPLSKSIVADVVPKERRGRMFGMLSLGICIGAMVGSVIGTQLSEKHVFGQQGWRVAFVLTGTIGAITGSSSYFCMRIPAAPGKAKEVAQTGNQLRSAVQELQRLGEYFQMPTFVLIVVQGCFGAMPWGAFGYSSLYYRISGLQENQVSFLLFIGQLANAVGSLLGGVVGDELSRKWPEHGRPLTAQISVFSGIPIVVLLYIAPIPPDVPAFFYYMFLAVCMGLTATWCGTGVNAPILCELVSPSSTSTVMAWEGALEGAFASFFSNMLVALLGQTFFGYNFQGVGGEADETNKGALGKAIAFTCLPAWLICFCAFTLLHWSYPADLRRLRHQYASVATPKPSETTVVYGAEQMD